MLTTAQTSMMAAAKTPEEAAQLFKGLVTQVIGDAVAKALDEAVASTKSSTVGSSSIDGWADLIGGAAMQMAWDRMPGGLTTGQLTYFAPRQMSDTSMMGSMSVGISISGTF